jgi:ATP-binding cassette subfamily C (CFTR/MRP) protein 1
LEVKFLPVGLLVSLIGSIVVIGFVISRQTLWLEAIERRISSTTAMLGSMKGIKMTGLKEILVKSIHGLRLEELTISKRFRRILIWNMAFGTCFRSLQRRYSNPTDSSL